MFQSHISSFDQIKGIPLSFFGFHVEFSRLWTGYSMNRAIDHKNIRREILEKFVVALMRLTFSFLSFLTLYQRRNIPISFGSKTK